MNALLPAAWTPWVAGVLLVSARVSALLLMTPVLHAIPVPASIRVALVLALSAALAMPLAAPQGVPAEPETLFTAFLGELAIGATLGLGVLMAFSGFALAGRLLDLQIGYGMGQVLDPLTRAQVPVLTSAFGIAGAVFFFLVNGHHALLRGVAFSLERFPAGHAWPIQQAAVPVIKQAAGLFTLGFALAAPVVLVLLLVEFVLGVLARNLPQANMLVLGLPVKMVVGLAALSLWAADMAPIAGRMFGQIQAGWSNLFALAAPGAR